MTCDETRERFSDLVDERLAPDEGAGVSTHLEGCAACRAELERFRATVSLIRSIEPVRAPAGFAERVLASARVPAETAVEPWWRRLGSWLVFPIPVKLPLEAAAIVLVGVGVVYLYQRTPELQQAARMENPGLFEQSELRAELSRSEPSTPEAALSSPPEPSTRMLAPPAPSQPPTSTIGPPAPTGAPPAQRQPSTPATGRVPSKPAPASPEVTPSKDTSVAATEDKKESTEVHAKRSRADAARPAPATPEPPRRVLRDAPRERTEESARAESLVRQAAPPAATQAPAAREPASGATARLAMKSAASNVTGALTVGSRVTAAAALRELASRHRGRIVGSREEPDATVVDLRVPREEYPALVAGLDTIGRWRAERESAELPVEVGVTVRLVQ